MGLRESNSPTAAREGGRRMDGGRWCMERGCECAGKGVRGDAGGALGDLGKTWELREDLRE